MQTKNQGYIYYAVGPEATREARQSIDSLLHFNPKSSVTVHTDDKALFRGLPIKLIKASSSYSKWYRVQILLETPYDETFFIDSDTLFNGTYDCFRFLDKSNICLAKTFLTDTINTDLPDNALFYNSGVIGYRLNNHISSLFEQWRADLEANPKSKDEPVLRRLIYTTQLPVSELPPTYNFRVEMLDDKIDVSQIRLLHGHGDLKQYLRGI